MGVMLTERPDLFGAVHCGSPLLDMRRFNKLLAGASWMDEYGNPDKPEDWAYIQQFSPYQNTRRDTNYPPILITTSTRDDRVRPDMPARWRPAWKNRATKFCTTRTPKAGTARRPTTSNPPSWKRSPTLSFGTSFRADLAHGTSYCCVISALNSVEEIPGSIAASASPMSIPTLDGEHEPGFYFSTISMSSPKARCRRARAAA